MILLVAPRTTPRTALVAVSTAVLLVLGATACAGGGAPSATAPVGVASARQAPPVPTAGEPSSSSARVRALPTGGVPDYQLGGAYAPAADVTVVERDSTARPAAGVYSICYVNGFQTQPDETDDWLDHHPDAVLRDEDGEPVSDPGWPDEVLLDTRTAATRAEVLAVLSPVVARCADRGFAAVEFDNLDSWTRSDGRLTPAGNLALAADLVRTGHAHGLAVGQKNTPQLGATGRQRTGFDFVVAEECVQYDECSAYTDVYGDQVVDVEYADTLGRPWSEVCALPDRPAMTILRDRDLVVPSDPAYVAEHC